MDNNLKKDKAFEAPVDANALSNTFDGYNGDFDTADELIRALLHGDARALAALSGPRPEGFAEALDALAEELREYVELAMKDPRAFTRELHLLRARLEARKKNEGKEDPA